MKSHIYSPFLIVINYSRHLKADLKASHVQPGKPVEEMTVEEKHFYHFKMHDYDNNNLLDGLELLQSANVHHDDSFHGHHAASIISADQEKKQPSNDNEMEPGLQHLVGKSRQKEMVGHSNATDDATSY